MSYGLGEMGWHMAKQVVEKRIIKSKAPKKRINLLLPLSLCQKFQKYSSDRH